MCLLQREAPSAVCSGAVTDTFVVLCCPICERTEGFADSQELEQHIEDHYNRAQMQGEGNIH